jgi:hypothetical protein
MGEKFKLGDTVRWTSQAGGHVRTKQGKIVELVPSELPGSLRELEQMFPDCSVASTHGHGYPRNHESYIVRVPSGTKAKDRLYWPRVSALELVVEF